MRQDPPAPLESPAFKAAAHGWYAQGRARHPVIRIDRRGGPLWLVLRYADVLALFRDPRFGKDPARVRGRRPSWSPRIVRVLGRNMLDRDPPDHTRLRALVQLAFTPRRVDVLRPRIEQLVDQLLEPARRSGRIELVRELALPLPSAIIAELIGVPPADRNRFQRWSGAIVAAETSGWGMLAAVPALMAFTGYVRSLLRLRRADPADDLASALIEAQQSGDRLDEDELVAMVFLLLVAGHETTMNFLGNAVLALLESGGLLATLADPAQAEGAVEELLRFAGPLELATERYALEDVVIGEVTVPRGARVHGVLASANRDEHFFPSPDRLHLGRAPNRHLAFGYGIHHCLGASLARLESQIALTALAALPGLRLADGWRPSWRRGLMLRGLEQLPLEAG